MTNIGKIKKIQTLWRKLGENYVLKASIRNINKSYLFVISNSFVLKIEKHER